MTIDDIMRAAPVIPVLVLDGERDYCACAHLRRSRAAGARSHFADAVALAAIRAMAEVPGAIVGAGTVLDERHLGKRSRPAAASSCRPASPRGLALPLSPAELPSLPGVATARRHHARNGSRPSTASNFSAEASGGIAALKALSAPFARARFFPTGG